jgi:hypothetical protein
MGSEQPHRTTCTGCLAVEAIQVKDSGGKAGGVEGRFGGMADPARGQTERRKVGLTGVHTLVEKAAVQFDRNGAGDVLQVQPTVDTGSAQT